jgi:hypothetical protein
LNSFGALDIALDVIKEKLVDEKIAELVLKGSRIEKTAVKCVTATEAQKMENYGPLVSQKKIIPEVLIKYGKAVSEALGCEKFKRLFSYFPVSVARKLEFVNDVLTAPRRLRETLPSRSKDELLCSIPCQRWRDTVG